MFFGGTLHRLPEAGYGSSEISGSLQNYSQVAAEPRLRSRDSDRHPQQLNTGVDSASIGVQEAEKV